MTERFKYFQPIITIAILGIILFASCSTNLLAEDAKTAEQRAEKLQEFYKGLTSITFDFSQISRVGGRDRQGRGNAVFIKQTSPEKRRSIMRWNYEEPDKQVIISDGNTLTIYTDKDKQLIKTSAQELESDITFAFFAGTRNLLDDFEALPAQNGYVFSSSKNFHALRLVPRQPHNQIKEVSVWTDDSNIIHHMLIMDHFDAVTELTFENIAINSIKTTDVKTIESITSFPIPPGTEIITQ